MNVHHLLDDPAKLRRRNLLDRGAGLAIRFFGVLVIGIVILILAYLALEVAPLLGSGEAEQQSAWDDGPAAAPQAIAVRDAAPPILTELGELALVPDLARGQVVQLRLDGAAPGTERGRDAIGLPAGFSPQVARRAHFSGQGWLLADGQGRLWALQPQFRRKYAEDEAGQPLYHQGTTLVSYDMPLGGQALQLNLRETPADMVWTQLPGGPGVALAHSGGVHLAALRAGGGLSFSGPSGYRVAAEASIPWNVPVVSVAVLQDGTLVWVDKRGGMGWAAASAWGGASQAEAHTLPLPQGQGGQVGKPALVMALLGARSLVVADDGGGLRQLRPGFSEQPSQAGQPQWGRRYQAMPAAVRTLVAEGRRKGFWALDAQGHLGAYYLGEPSRILLWRAPDGAATADAQLGLAPRLDKLLLLRNGSGRLLRVDNEHPEASWGLLWGRVEYEGYDEPRFLWQSSAANNDFEPKLSLTPLVVGTLKGAFYAMLFAVPLALFGALYTAQFMPSSGRAVVKPVIELMGALPTVVLGFLGGLWLAPMVEGNLLGVLLAPAGLVLAFLACGFGLGSLRPGLRERLQGADYLLAVPVAVAAVWLSLQLGESLQGSYFAGNFAAWLDTELGLSYTQRNGLIVGMAMGFAVIPIIFSISEDAFYEVPRRLTEGGLALGATPWQTAVRIVVPAASAGIFAALMIGLGRAVGETMIVMMATGNTPIMDVDIFSGMRTLSANIAVEMPEAEVGSTHFHLLFLSAFLLMAITFVVNTLAELVRERLRAKYAAL